jgi:Glyoxalase-like domain
MPTTHRRSADFERLLWNAGEWATLPGYPRINFMKVPEGKTTKNRMHIDWHAPDREAEVARLIALGATRLWDIKNENFEWTTMADVEGNEFCIVQGPNQADGLSSAHPRSPTRLLVRTPNRDPRKPRASHA